MFKKSKQSNKKPFNRKKNYSHDREENQDFSDLPKVIGVYSQARNSDFGFIDIEGQDKGYFVYPKNLGTAFDGDEVEAFIKTFNGRKEAVITKVLKRADRVLVGTLELKKSFGFVILDNPLFKKDIFIPYKNIEQHKNLKDGYKVAIKITKWEAKNPEGKIFEVLGDKNKAGVDVESLILEAGLKTRFPQIVTDEAEKLKFKEKVDRVDLTNTLIFTIDGEDAKDLDDAISIERIDPPLTPPLVKGENTPHLTSPLADGGIIPPPLSRGEGGGSSYRLIVSIADVSEYVKDESFLNKEALKRGNSTYLPDRVIPMLPEKISNDLCSLNPNTKKLSLSCEVLIDKSGKIVSKKVYESIISSKFRLTYKEVQKIINNEQGIINNLGVLKIGDDLKFGGVVTQELVNKIKLSYELKQIIDEKKKEIGVLDFDFPEIKIILDKENNPIKISKYERFESHKIIEQFMILANECVGELFSKIPFLYRIHPIPKEDDIEKLRKTLGLFDIKLAYKKLTPLLISQILEEIKKSPKERLLSKLVLRSLEKAIYSHENEGHFGLGLEFYSHFTSPIRRYPDLIIHRIIKEKLHNKLNTERIEYYKSILKNIGKKTSDTERASEKLEYGVKDLFICKYYKDKIGLEEKGIISGIIPAGVFIELENGVEGFLSLDNILLSKNIKKAVYEEEFMRFVLGNNQFLQIGDEVKIKLSGIDDERRRLLFDLVQ